MRELLIHLSHDGFTKVPDPSTFKENVQKEGAALPYLGPEAAQHHVSEQFGSKHGETGAQHVGYNGQREA